MNELLITDNLSIQDKIYTIRNMQVMVERDLAELYGVETRRLNEQVKKKYWKIPGRIRKLGLLQGKLLIPDGFNGENDEINSMFLVKIREYNS